MKRINIQKDVESRRKIATTLPQNPIVEPKKEVKNEPQPEEKADPQPEEAPKAEGATKRNSKKV